MDCNRALLGVLENIEAVDPDMTVAELRVLLVVGVMKSVGQSEVAKKFTRSLVSRHVASLSQKRGCVRVEDTGRQLNILHITNAGLDLLNTITAPIRREHERAQEGTECRVSVRL